MKISFSSRLSALILAGAAFAAPAAAQNSTVTPYSRFGYGVLEQQANTQQRGMGGVGIAMRSGRQINFMNPASYASIDTLTFLFDIAANTKMLRTEEGKESGHNFTGGLDYAVMQFPITRYGGAAIGLAPWSQVGYSFGNEIVNGENSRQGSGTVSELFLGLSARPFKGFTLGVNVSYMFGTLLNDNYVLAQNGSTSSTSLFERVLEVRDWNIRAGVQYGFDINRSTRLTLGVIYEPEKDFHGSSYGTKYDVGSDEAPTEEEIGGSKSMKGRYTKAATYGAGINLEWANRLTAEVDFSYQPWKNARYTSLPGYEPAFGQDGTRFDDRWRVGAGAQWTTNPRGNYLQRMNFRLGGYYCHDYLQVAGNNVFERGVSLGVGFPAPSEKTVINLALEWRNRQATPAALVKENYFVVTLGVNFNELWFWQSKIR